MTTNRLYACGFETTTMDDVAKEVLETLAECSAHLYESQDEAIKTIDEYFDDSFDPFNPNTLKKDYLVFEIDIKIKPKKVIHKKGNVNITTKIEKI